MDYLEINRKLWNERTKVHVGTDFYDMNGFLAGKSSLQTIETSMLGDIKGKTLLHLQCHFGQDTLSLARLGAEVTGIDLSDEAIRQAEAFSRTSGIPGRFINCDLYSLPDHLEGKFDIVFTTYGTIGWLPDLDRWAKVVAHFLQPGGRFIFAEFHPVVWMFDPHFKFVEYSYFKDKPIVEAEKGTYADPEAPLQLEAVSWNHSIDETVTALLESGLEMKSFREYPYSPYRIFPEMTEVAPGEYHIKGLEGMLPMVYSIEMRKPA